jgi:hypothetical protein
MLDDVDRARAVRKVCGLATGGRWQTRLPTALAAVIFAFLDTRAMFCVRRVCPLWRRFAADPRTFRHVDLADFNISPDLM